jgi:signal transduction histidine kinase
MRLASFARRHETMADLALALGILLIAIPDALIERSHPIVPLLFDCALVLPLVWRRRWPSGVFAVLAVVAGAQWIADVKVLGDAALVVALYTVAAQEPRRRAALAAGVVELGAVLATLRWGSDDFFKTFVGLSGVTLAAFGLGTSVRQRRAYQASLEDRAARLEIERDQQGRLAAAAERARIAREMHDIVAHNLSVMIALADGATFAAERSPERSASAMQSVSATGRQALGEMRRLLGVLRDDESAGTLLPQPGILDIDRLVDQVRAAGLPVALAIEGDARALPAGAQLTVYRLVQEALTNSLKHAGPEARAEVSLRFDAAGVDVEISDDGAGEPAPAQDGHGLGLNGMRERAAVYAGIVQAGPLPAGGWRVHTRLAFEPPGTGT